MTVRRFSALKFNAILWSFLTLKRPSKNISQWYVWIHSSWNISFTPSGSLVQKKAAFCTKTMFSITLINWNLTENLCNSQLVKDPISLFACVCMFMMSTLSKYTWNKHFLKNDRSKVYFVCHLLKPMTKRLFLKHTCIPLYISDFPNKYFLVIIKK